MMLLNHVTTADHLLRSKHNRNNENNFPQQDHANHNTKHEEVGHVADATNKVKAGKDSDTNAKKEDDERAQMLKAVKPDTFEVADPSPEHLKKSSKTVEREKLCGVGGMIDETSYSVIAKIRRGIIETQRRRESSGAVSLSLDNDQKKQTKPPKILCMVYTYEGAHKTNLQSIVDTWASQCDGFLAASNVTDATLGAVDIKFFGPEAYGNMWNKIEAMWKYAYKNYLNDYDYFHICGDDTYVIPDNLRAYLMGTQVDALLNGHLDQFSTINGKVARWKTTRPRPLLLGFPITFSEGKHKVAYAAGGSGCK